MTSVVVSCFGVRQRRNLSFIVIATSEASSSILHPSIIHCHPDEGGIFNSLVIPTKEGSMMFLSSPRKEESIIDCHRKRSHLSFVGFSGSRMFGRPFVKQLIIQKIKCRIYHSH